MKIPQTQFGAPELLCQFLKMSSTPKSHPMLRVALMLLKWPRMKRRINVFEKHLSDWVRNSWRTVFMSRASVKH